MKKSEFLANLGAELREQHNRSTEHPLFVVQQEERIWGMDSGYADHSAWVDAEGDMFGSATEVREQIKADEGLAGHFTSIDPYDYGYNKVYYKTIWVFVTAHFTEMAAQRYINQNAHNLSEPRIYVTSQYRCDEWNSVVTLLKEALPSA